MVQANWVLRASIFEGFDFEEASVANGFNLALP